MSITNLVSEPENTDALIGERVHRLMWRNHVTQTALGPIMGVGQSAVSAKLRGRRGWSADDLVIVARHFGVSVGYLFGEDDGTVVGPAGIEPTTSTV